MFQVMTVNVIVGLFLLCTDRSGAFVAPGATLARCTQSTSSTVTTFLSNVPNAGWDDDVDYKKEFKLNENGELPDQTSGWDDLVLPPSLGIQIGQQVALTERQVAILKKEASEMINEKIDEGIQDIERMRTQMKIELDKSRELMKIQSELNAQYEAEKLMAKIDQMTGNFLDSTKDSRQMTKLASSADTSMEGQTVELGSWGSVSGAAVPTSGMDSIGESQTSTGNENQLPIAPSENKILVIADESQDPMAKELIPAFCSLLQKSMDVKVDVLKPTATMPLGANQASCVIFFAASLSLPPTAMMDRLLRRTLQAGGALGSPPTQLVCVSTIGTERTEKMPYTMQNLFGGKLDKRRQIEEYIISTVQRRTVEPPLTYTICKFGDIKQGDGDFQFQPGDTLDGTTTAELAANVLVQAVAFQPFARNATLCAVGSLPGKMTDEMWDQSFLRLDGPELWRIENVGDSSGYNQLVEYVREWSEVLVSGKGLTTPLRAERSNPAPNPEFEGVKARAGAKLLFLPTNTGSAYRSKDEEREAESSTGKTPPMSLYNGKLEGGVEVLVEVTTKDYLRVRARRCNMADTTTIKELSEETILNRLQDCITVWKKNQR